MTTENMLADAYALASSRQMACADDIALLASVMDKLSEMPTVVLLGAGSGTMSLAVYAMRPLAFLVTVDHDPDSLKWEALALANSTGDAGILNHVSMHVDSKKAGQNYRAVNVDLLIVDASHTYEGVRGDLVAWMPNMQKGGLIFVHDYDGATAPEQYSGVRQACNEVFGQRPKFKRGWSAVFPARYRKAFADQFEPLDSRIRDRRSFGIGLRWD